VYTASKNAGDSTAIVRLAARTAASISSAKFAPGRKSHASIRTT